MLAGPIFTREATTAPRQLRHFLARAGYVAALFVLMYTADQAVFGWQQVRTIGDTARFGTLLFEIFSLVQLPLVLFFALIFCAGSIAQEKDRRTLLLLLMTDLSATELVVGKLASSLLIVLVLIGVSAPVFFLVHLLGGVSADQILWVLALCLAVAVAAGSWGALVAFWREKTFQTLAIGVLGIVGFLGIVEASVAFLGPLDWLVALNPFRTLLKLVDPFARDRNPVAIRSVTALSGLGLTLIGVTIQRLRTWNPSRTTYTEPEEETDAESGETRVRHRRIWANPVIWREIRTRAYGRKVQLIKLAYLLLAAAVVYLLANDNDSTLMMNRIPPASLGIVGLSLLSLLLINAQAVTSLTSERDGKTLDLLLATEITASEFIYGKLGGIAYNTKELIVVPLALTAWQATNGDMLWETFTFLMFGFLILVAFAAMLGLHSSLTFEDSRAAIGNSLGTLFFLFIGIFVFLLLLVEASGSLASQLLSFVVFIGLGSICLWASLTHKNPSPALTLAAGWLPFMTFYSITEFLREGSLSVCIAIVAVYGFTSLAMLVPAVSAFDVALGRTTGNRG